MAEEGTPPQLAELEAELRSMKPGARRKRAVAAGATEDELEEVDDADDPKAAMVALVIKYEAPPVDDNAALIAELEAMKPGARRKRAVAAGATEDELEEADDADDPQAAVIALVVKYEAPPPAADADNAALIAELEAMKPGARRKRAVAAGANEDELEEADDADNPQAAMIALIIKYEALPPAPDNSALIAELEAMKPGARRKRAVAAGANEDELEEVDDAEDPQAAMIALIIKYEAPPPTSVATIPTVKPHFSAADSGDSKTTRFESLFGDKHCMFSYNWAVQEEVKAARAEVGAAGVPTWMDIDGGMKADIYDSMAEGVQNAACLVCFMTQAYQDSANCALELKFAKQSGIPVVPVLMEAPDASGHPWQAGGWLGVITAGSLWTPLYDPTSFAENIPNLLRQIEIAVAPDEDQGDASATDFSAEDAREELERLRKDEQPAAVSSAGGMCALPIQVPDLPEGLRITPEMKQLLSALVSSDKKRIGFCGMGGIGKTTISTWLVREEGTRKQYDQIVWITLGQHPNIEKLQELMHLDLTDSKFEGDPTPEEKLMALKKAMAGQNLLLVLDDLWESEHEKLLNFIDDTTDSKVLVSSRVRGVLEGAEVVDIGLPTEEEAVQILLSVAGLPLDAAPPEAREVVKFCDRLPLALGIAGKLVHEMGVTDDWDGVVELMQEEFSDSGQDRSMEERIIRTSLSAIKGLHRNKILRLFHALAIVPEDTRIPIEVVAMLFEAESETPLAKPPSLLNIRRWLKVLIDRSLILGTVDRPSLHDIVMDFVVSSKSDEARRGMNRRLVDLWRSRRPPGGWDTESKEGVPQYITLTAVHHINGAWESDWSNDEGSIAWLSDFVDGKQDAIPVFASQALGAKRVAELAKAAEDAEDWWLASLRWSASALSEHMLGYYGRSLPVLLAAAEALEHVPTTQTDKSQLEMSVLLMAVGSFDPSASLKCAARVEQIVESDSEAGDIFARMQAVMFAKYHPLQLAGDHEECSNVMITIMRMEMDAYEKVHARDRTRRCQLSLWACAANITHLCYQNPDFDWDVCCGQGGGRFADLVKEYDYERMHADCKHFSYDFLVCYPGWAVGPLLHWGDVVAATTALDRMYPFALRCAEDWSVTDIYEHYYFKTTWPFWLYFFGRKEDARALLYAGPFDELEPIFDWLSDNSTAGVLLARGATEGGGLGATDDFLMHGKFLELLLTDEAPLTSALALLPEPRVAADLGLTLPWGNFFATYFSTITTCMLAHERAGSAEGALASAAIILCGDRTKGGTEDHILHCLAHSCRGRILAGQGKADDAEAAFEAALAAAAPFDFHFLTAIALRDLCRHVLDGAGRGEEGRKRLEEVVARLACSVEDLDGYVYP